MTDECAKVTVLPREILGMIFAWWGSGGRPPQWHRPDEPPIGAEWTGLRSSTLRFRSHPQETTENSVDMEHLAYTHGYKDVEPTAISINGAYLKSCFDFRNVSRIAGLVDNHEERRFVPQDIVIRYRKRYRSPVRLCRTDGPIGKCRRYCRHFYPDLQPAGRTTPQEAAGGGP